MRIVFLYLISFLLFAYGGEVLSDTQLDLILKSNLTEFETAEKYCINYKNLRSIKLEDNRLSFNSIDSKNSLKDIDVTNMAIFFRKINISQMDCYGLYENDIWKLAGVRFIFLPKNALFFPKLTSIHHAIGMVDSRWLDDRKRHHIVRPLSLEAWYVYDLMK